MRISNHAIERYIERFPDWSSNQERPTRKEAEVAIRKALVSERAESVSPHWLRRPKPLEPGTEFIHLYNHCLVLCDNTVVTVLSKGCVTRLRQKLGRKPIR